LLGIEAFRDREYYFNNIIVFKTLKFVASELLMDFKN